MARRIGGNPRKNRGLWTGYPLLKSPAAAAQPTVESPYLWLIDGAASELHAGVAVGNGHAVAGAQTTEAGGAVAVGGAHATATGVDAHGSAAGWRSVFGFAAGGISALTADYQAGGGVAVGFDTIKSADQAAGMQLAIWEAIEDSGPQANFQSGRFQVIASQAVISYAQQYYAAGRGKKEAVFLVPIDGRSQAQITPSIKKSFNETIN